MHRDWGLDWTMALISRIDFDRIGGGAIALAMAAWGGFLKDLFQHTGDLVFSAKKRGEAVLSNPVRHRMPYAPAIAIGTLISFFAR